MNILVPQFKKLTPICLMVVALGSFAFSPEAQAAPAPETPDPGAVGGVLNTADGQSALPFVTTGVANSAFGAFALFSTTTGKNNTAVGAGALDLNNIGESNTAVGVAALLLNTTGGNNTATGAGALLSNTTGAQNTATGYAALGNNTGDNNTADGAQALAHNTIGGSNTAVGFFALNLNTTGNRNTAMGDEALLIAGGSDNTAVGTAALTFNTNDGNTAVGSFALVGNQSGSLNTALGQNAGLGLIGGESNNIDIGANVDGVAGESNTIRIGNTDITDTYISGISGTTVASGAAVLVDSNGHLGTVTSSKRFKEEIRPMNKTSEAIFSLEPVTFRYRKEIDPAGTSQFGLIAEEVARVNPALVLPDKEGKPYTVRYDAVNAMLLNEFLKEHRKNEEQQVIITRLQNRVEALTAGLQKVSAQLEVSKSAPQVVNNNQ
jgi:Chaperone of endosialidase